MDQENLLKKIDEMFQKFDTLEKSLQDKSNRPVILKMDVQHLHLQQLNLEELAFHLDKLDIKELSGMLNLGNTFSPTVHKKPMVKKHSPSNYSQKQGEEEIEIKINGKSVPYTII